jgi:hypothetical protein
MLVSSCSWELSGRKNTPEDKKVTNSARGEAEYNSTVCSATLH